MSTKFILEYFGSGQTYSSQCGANCVDVFSAQVSSADAVSNENVDFINGSCTDVDAGEATCTFNTGIFTVAPNCTCSTGQFSGDRPCHVTTTSSVASVYTTFNGVGTNNNFTLSCQKQGADFTVTRTVVGSFKEVVTTVGKTSPDIQSVQFGTGADCSGACTTGTCIRCNQVGSKITSVTWQSTGTYRLNGLDGTKYNCSGGGIGVKYAPTLQNTNTSTSSYVTVVNGVDTTPQNAGSNVVVCHGYQ